ncbi:endonuclease MutS2 [Bacillota bacterium]
MRLCNPKTKVETGFDYVLNALRILTPYGRKRLKVISAYEPGKEEELRLELDRLEKTIILIKDKSELAEFMQEILLDVKDNSFTIERSVGSVLSVVELYEIKTLLLQMEKIGAYLEAASQSGIQIPEAFRLIDLKVLLDELDPDKERINTFYLYDAFSEKLASLRKEKRQAELEIRRLQKEQKCKIEGAYGIVMTPKFEYMVAKSDKELMSRAADIPGLMLTDEDYMTAVFTLKPGEEVDTLKRSMEEINEAIDEEEIIVREILSSKIGGYKTELTKNCEALGELDFNFAKALFSIRHECIKPEIAAEHVLVVLEGRQLMLEDVLQKKGKKYLPVSIELLDGVTCITGANMGGKTISLKMAGQCALLAQHGFFVPCRSARIGLSSYVHILVGDSQNLQRGLSSFGSEMEELKEILDRSKSRALLLIDEIASGTNPIEGQALTKSIISYLSDKPYISLITTHFDNVSTGNKIRNMQVRGLAGANFENLSREIRYANRRERIEIIGKYMDYRLYEVSGIDKTPRDALNIAQMLGLDRDIIEQARKFMEDRKDEKQA